MLKSFENDSFALGPRVEEIIVEDRETEQEQLQRTPKVENQLARAKAEVAEKEKTEIYLL